MKNVVIILACITIFCSPVILGGAGSSQKSFSATDFLLDKSKPYVYLEVDHIGLRTKRSESEPPTGIWLRLRNNCILPIVIHTFGVPPGSSAKEIGVLDNVVPNPQEALGEGGVRSLPVLGSGGSGQSSSNTEKEDKAANPSATMPSGYRFPVGSFQAIQPGQSVYFSLPIDHVTDAWHVEIPFSFDLKVQSQVRGAENFVALYKGDLPLVNR